MSNLKAILENSDKLNDSLSNILDALRTMDLPKLNYMQEDDTIDKIVEKAGKVGNKILDSKTIKNTNDNLNSILSDAGSYTMMLSIPVLAMTLATGAVGYLFIAPVLAIGGYATKKYADRNISIIKTSGKIVKDRTTKTKEKLKSKLQDKKEQKILENDPIAQINDEKCKVTTYQFVSITIKRIQDTIKTINDRIAFICYKLKNEEFDCSKDELMMLLQNDVLNSIIKIKIDMNNLNRIKMETSFYPDKINAVLMQCKYAIDAMCENMLITNEMMQNKMKEINYKQA